MIERYRPDFQELPNQNLNVVMVPDPEGEWLNRNNLITDTIERHELETKPCKTIAEYEAELERMQALAALSFYDMNESRAFVEQLAKERDQLLDQLARKGSSFHDLKGINSQAIRIQNKVPTGVEKLAADLGKCLVHDEITLEFKDEITDEERNIVLRTLNVGGSLSTEEAKRLFK